MPVHDIFSKRDKPLPDVFQTNDIPKELRAQVQWIWEDTIYRSSRRNSFGDRVNPILQGLWCILCREHGRTFLHRDEVKPERDIAAALMESKDTLLVLDIIEQSFRMIMSNRDFGSKSDREGYIEELNHRFRENGVGYQFDPDARKLIPFTDTVTHQELVRPTLKLLAAPGYQSANTEYMDAFDDYKKSDFDDCLTKCCSCFESVMKIICDKKGWPYNHNDTAQQLLQTVIRETGMPAFFTQPLLLIATTRNRLSSSHGAGTQQRPVPEHYARYALHATASAILLLTEAAK